MNATVVTDRHRLVVVSRRVGSMSGSRASDGLASALVSSLKKEGGVWFGWSGETSQDGTSGELRRRTVGAVERIRIDLTVEERKAFDSGYANAALWPILHYRPDMASFDPNLYAAYRMINQRFAARIGPLLADSDMIWVHDYHYLPLGRELRGAGFSGRIGFFLHTPFPPPEIISALTTADDLVRSMIHYDLIGFQTRRDCRNFALYLTEELAAAEIGEGTFRLGDRSVRIGAFPVGIDAVAFEKMATGATDSMPAGELSDVTALRQVIGVDRLDYTRGIPERFGAFDQLLRRWPEHRGTVSFLQIAPLSRAELKGHRALQRELDGLASRINGQLATLDWTPIRMIARRLNRRHLAGMFRASRVGLVTPLRDGMNLVAKEYVAAQDPDDPGVLVLSRFAGAAEELAAGALLVSPHDQTDIAGAIHTALTMPRAERIRRSGLMRQKVFANSVELWAQSFVDALARTRAD